MSPKERIEDLIISIRTSVGLALYYPANLLFIRPACWLLAMKPVTSMGLHSLVSRNDAERRYSRAGLELMISFANTYLTDDKLPESCYPCIFSSDGDQKNTSVCRHKELPRYLSNLEIKNENPVPEYCPLKAQCTKTDGEVCPFRGNIEFVIGAEQL